MCSRSAEIGVFAAIKKECRVRFGGILYYILRLYMEYKGIILVLVWASTVVWVRIRSGGYGT